MALISELYFILLGVKKAPDWEKRIIKKAQLLSDNGAYWIDFGTRRRFSLEVQDRVVDIMRGFKGFLGTSNPHLACKYGVTPSGTFAHEYVQLCGCLYGINRGNLMATEHWSKHYHGDLGIALTDTFTTEVFLRDFGMYQAKLYDGVRHDSNDPYIWGENMLAHYQKLGILTSNKRLVFSDNLKVAEPSQKMVGDAFNYIPLAKHFEGRAQPVGGIGTFLSNDCISDEDKNNRHIKPLNMVIKLTQVRPTKNSPYIPVVKLSDVAGKNSGTPEAIAMAKAQLGIA
jgi:nicotinate phosphoribosyltransferase